MQPVILITNNTNLQPMSPQKLTVSYQSTNQYLAEWPN